MRRRLALAALLGLMLASCAPLTAAVSSVLPAADSPPAAVTFLPGEYTTIVFDSADRPANIGSGADFKIWGYNLVVNDRRCVGFKDGHLECALGTVQPGHPYKLYARGKPLAVTGWYTRPPDKTRFPFTYP